MYTKYNTFLLKVNTALRVSCFGGGLLLVFNLVTVSGLARILIIAFVQEHQQGVTSVDPAYWGIWPCSHDKRWTEQQSLSCFYQAGG